MGIFTSPLLTSHRVVTLPHSLFTMSVRDF